MRKTYMLVLCAAAALQFSDDLLARNGRGESAQRGPATAKQRPPSIGGKVKALHCRPPLPSIVAKKINCPKGYSWHKHACCKGVVQFPQPK